MFKKQDPVAEPRFLTPMEVERNRLMADRDFWTDCVSWLLQDDCAADSSIKQADELLAARRERFPV